MPGLFGQHIQVTEKAMDLRLQRQNLVTANVANINTPGYKARRLEFEKQMQHALDLDATGRMTRTSGEHLPSVFHTSTFKGDITSKFEPRIIYGEDSVDIDKEMSELAKNSQMYSALAQIIRKNFTGMQKVIMASKS